MSSPSASSPGRITHLGTLAGASLVPGSQGKVLASLSGATYLLTDDGRLFWLVSGGSPLHRRALRALSPLPRPADGAPFRVDAQSLTIGPGPGYDMRAALLWQAPEIDPLRLMESPRILPRVQDLFSRLDLSAAQGFGNFIPGILALARGAPPGPLPGSGDPVLTFARPLVMDVALACREGQPSRILQSAAALIGLGAGLTPSGDDFAGGVFFAIRALQDAYRLPGSSEDSFNLAPYETLTHLISFTLLQDLAKGHAVSPLHRLLTGIISAEPLDFLQRSFARLTRLGHSTGWDLLAGLVTGLLVTAADRHPGPVPRELHSLRT